VQRRVARLDHLEALTELDQEAATLVQKQLQPCWTQVRGAIAEAAGTGLERVLNPAERCVSPSDFGFHNALADSAGRLGFFDFEYAGWDDPAKLICDFFCQPELPVAREHWDFFLQTVGRVLPGGSSLAARSQLLLPAYRIKWCCIMLNDFVATDQARREFALGDLAAGERKRSQLEKTRKALAEVGRSE
jgi:hypothetical protein